MTSALCELKEIPYGKASFEAIQERNFLYVDKTPFIEALEHCGSDTPFLVRPRRFGKTLFTDMLRVYYDKAAAERFEKNFAGTYIGAHKTPLANTFYVLSLDFSGISPDRFVDAMIDKMKESIVNFNSRYPFPQAVAINEERFEDPVALLSAFMRAFELEFKNGKIYLIIDEYDQFANEILASDVRNFKKLTAAGGVLKVFYSYLKEKATKGPISRVFITGVTSISLDSMTSGFNIASNFTTDPEFTPLFGFTEAELKTLIPQVLDLKKAKVSSDALVSRMREWYNGYRFSMDSEQTVFNASMCLYYLRSWKRVNHEPRQLLDPAVSPDLSKPNGILRLGDRSEVESIVSAALAGKVIPFDAEPSVLNLQTDDRLSRQGILTALYYMGYLTYASGDRASLVMPNRAMAQQFFDIYFSNLRNIRDWKESLRTNYEEAIEALEHDDPAPLLEAITDRLATCCGKQKNLHLKESDFQTALLMASNYALNYETLAELEVRGKSGGFVDVLLKSKTGGTSYLFELKYLPKSRGTKAVVDQLLTEAVRQANEYAEGENIRHIPRLMKVSVVFVGMEVKALHVERSKAS